MNLFVLIADEDGTGGRFLEEVTPLVPKDKLEVFRGFSALAERLRKPHDPTCTVLVLAPSHEDLRRIVPLREFLKDARFLLVLEDQSAETIALAHRILPTYISDLDDGPSGVVSVLKQLTRDAHAREGER
ncbi:MAG TPA: hypothetical protein VKT17_08125 [Acidobacteriota bacterium]|nr:hypothetical protein [Acidobacteriota bacterium]